MNKDFIYTDIDNFDIEHLYGSTYLIKTHRNTEKDKTNMGEIIIIISITLILTVISSFWLGYSYGKLRTIKSYETKQVETFEAYLSDMNTDYKQTHPDVSRETSERNN